MTTTSKSNARKSCEVGDWTRGVPDTHMDMEREQIEAMYTARSASQQKTSVCVCVGMGARSGGAGRKDPPALRSRISRRASEHLGERWRVAAVHVHGAECGPAERGQRLGNDLEGFFPGPSEVGRLGMSRSPQQVAVHRNWSWTDAEVAHAAANIQIDLPNSQRGALGVVADVSHPALEAPRHVPSCPRGWR